MNGKTLILPKIIDFGTLVKTEKPFFVADVSGTVGFLHPTIA